MNISIVSINMKLSIERHSVMMFIFPTCVCLLLTHWACLLSLRNMYKCLRHNSALSTAFEYEPWLALEYALHRKYCNMNGSHWDTSSSLEFVTFTLNIQRMYQSQKLETALYILNMQCHAELDMKIMYSISRFSLMICWARHNALIALP